MAALLDTTAVRPSISELAKLGVAGAMMGVELVAFDMLANSKLEASVSIPIIDSAMLVVSSVGAIYESISVQKVCGLALLVVAAVLAVLTPPKSSSTSSLSAAG